MPGKAGRPRGPGQGRASELWGQGGAPGRMTCPDFQLPRGFTRDCSGMFKRGCNAVISPRCLLSCAPLLSLGDFGYGVCFRLPPASRPSAPSVSAFTSEEQGHLPAQAQCHCHGCLSSRGLLQQNSTHRVAYKEQKFISWTSGSWKSKTEVPAWLGVRGRGSSGSAAPSRTAPGGARGQAAPQPPSGGPWRPHLLTPSSLMVRISTFGGTHSDHSNSNIT